MYERKNHISGFEAMSVGVASRANISSGKVDCSNTPFTGGIARNRRSRLDKGARVNPHKSHSRNLKRMMRTNVSAILQISILAVLFTPSVYAQHTLVIEFENHAGPKLLQRDSSYLNAFGESFTVRNFKYYISHILLSDGTETQSFNDMYFLIDDADSLSRKVVLTTGLKQVTALHFLLGVDSQKNVTGVQTGPLDPAKGMFWTWNTGYIMAKLEGNSPSAHAPQNAFGYHVGGYKTNENTVRQIDLLLPSAVDCKDGCTLNVTADVMMWFNGRYPIRIAESPSCHEPGILATKIADNYAQMFRIEKR